MKSFGLNIEENVLNLVCWKVSTKFSATVFVFFRKKTELNFFKIEIKFNYIAWKVSKYEDISGPYFPLFGLNTEI